VADASLNGRVGAEDVTDGFGTVEHAEHALRDIQAAVDEVCKQRGRDRGFLRRAFPQAERDLHAVARDPRGDDVERDACSTGSCVRA